jgi:hypothetical protein
LAIRFVRREPARPAELPRLHLDMHPHFRIDVLVQRITLDERANLPGEAVD